MTDHAIAEEPTNLNRDGLSSPNNIARLQDLMAETKPTRTLEIGFGGAGSGLAICAMHQRLGRQGMRQHVAIDPFQRTRSQSLGLARMDRAGLSSYMDFREDYSSFVLPKLLQDRQRFGLIYVDGSHMFEDVFVDAYYGVRLLDDRGVIAFDDCADPEVCKVIKFLRNNMPGLREIDLNRSRRNPLLYFVARKLGKVQMTGFERVGTPEREWGVKPLSF